MASQEQIRDGLHRRLSGIQRQGSVPIEVLDLKVSSSHPELLLVFRVCVAGEVWEVSLDYTGYEASLMSGDPAKESFDYLAFLARTHLFEWWHTKDTEKISARMGKRLD